MKLQYARVVPSFEGESIDFGDADLAAESGSVKDDLSISVRLSSHIFPPHSLSVACFVDRDIPNETKVKLSIELLNASVCDFVAGVQKDDRG